MKHNIINQRDEPNYEEIVDIEIELNDEDISHLSGNTGWHFSIPIHKKIGAITLTMEKKL